MGLALGSIGFAAADKPELKVDDVVRRLQQRYETTADFTADFRQTVDVPTLGKTLESSGRVFFKRPGRMRWEFLEPDQETIVADGSMLWVYQPQHRQVLKTPFHAAFQSATPVSFLFGVGKLADDFHASLIGVQGDTIRLRLDPKRDTEIGTLVLAVDRKSYDLTGAEITDPLGNVTRLTFSNLKRGVGVADSKFALQTPPGTDVVEAPAADSGAP